MMANRKQSPHRRVKFCTKCKLFNFIAESQQPADSMQCGHCGEPLYVSGSNVAALVLRLLNARKYDRRTALKLLAAAMTTLGVTGAGLTFYQFVADRFGPSLDERLYERLERLVRFPTLRESEFRFAETFHLDASLASLSLGRDDYPKGYHVDNLAAGLSVAGPLGLLEKERQPISTEGEIDAPLNADLILIGGPNSTPLTQIAWEFKGPHDYEQVRTTEPVIPLTYYGISDTLGLEPVGWSMEGQGNVPAYNWPFVCTDPRRPYRLIVPEYSSETIVTAREGPVPLLRTNYLLVTRLPNFLAPDFPQTVMNDTQADWPYLLVFEGNHGIGTRGVELLLTAASTSLLEKLHHSLGGTNAFQQMFRLGDIGLTPQGFHKFNSIELFGDVAPTTVPDSTYLQAHEQAIKRLRR